MIRLSLPGNRRPLRALCLGAHSDDIEIGCGGTVLELLRRQRPIEFDWVVFSAKEETRRDEAKKSASALLRGATGRHIALEKFRDGHFPYIGGEIKDYFETLKRLPSPDVIFTHCRNDLHQDHRLISELTWNTFRDHLILEYEVPKYDADLGSPSVYVPLDRSTVDKKIRLLLKHFPSQAKNRWFTEETFRAVLRLRGVESNAPSGYAEGFHGRKLTLG